MRLFSIVSRKSVQLYENITTKLVLLAKQKRIPPYRMMMMLRHLLRLFMFSSQLYMPTSDGILRTCVRTIFKGNCKAVSYYQNRTAG